MTLARQQRFDEAIDVLRDGLALTPESVDGHLNLGVVLGDKSLWEEALDEFRTAAELDSSSGPAHFQSGRAQYLTKRYEDAWDSLSVAHQILGDSPRAAVLPWRDGKPA